MTKKADQTAKESTEIIGLNQLAFQFYYKKLSHIHY